MKEKLERKVYYLYPSEIKKVKKLAKVRNKKDDRWSESRIIRELINK